MYTIELHVKNPHCGDVKWWGQFLGDTPRRSELKAGGLPVRVVMRRSSSAHGGVYAEREYDGLLLFEGETGKLYVIIPDSDTKEYLGWFDVKRSSYLTVGGLPQ